MDYERMDPDMQEWYRERGVFFEAALDEAIEWKCMPWWKRFWLRISDPDYREKAVREIGGRYRNELDDPTPTM